MSQIVTLNGKPLECKREPYLQVGSKPLHRTPVIINGKMIHGVNINGYDYPYIESDCVLHLPGLPGRGSSIWDRSKEGNHGTITGATWRRLPSGLWYLDFDGSDDVDLGNPTALQITGALTILTWKKSLNWGSKRVLTKMDYPNTKWQYDLQERYSVITSNGSTACERYRLTDTSGDVWHQIGLVYVPSTNLDLYTDGALDNDTLAGTIPAALQDTDATVYIGRRTDGDYFIGGLALIRIYNVALTATQILVIYNQERHLFGV